MDENFDIQAYMTRRVERIVDHITTTKNSHTRIIPMTDEVYDILHDLRKYRSVMQKDDCVDGKKGFIFYAKSGSLLNVAIFNDEPILTKPLDFRKNLDRFVCYDSI